ncbi:hypothetical protein LSAT2_000130 [Lamellibrachia satsuma]|nr:hypothetical protein LSAT2_000130 [Lamellibrachia satsuma]
MLRFDKKMELMKLVNSVDHLQPVIQVSLAQTLANCGSCKAGHEWLLNTTDWPIDSHITNNGKIVCNSCIHWLLHENSELNSAAAALAFALTRHKVSSNVAMEIGTALIQLATKKLSLTDGEHVLQSVYKCMSINQEVVDLASIMQLDLGKFSSLSPKLNYYWAKHRRLRLVAALSHDSAGIPLDGGAALRCRANDNGEWRK